jgi:hypothetical protein
VSRAAPTHQFLVKDARHEVKLGIALRLPGRVAIDDVAQVQHQRQGRAAGGERRQRGRQLGRDFAEALAAALSVPIGQVGVLGVGDDAK